ncbi:glycosyltransferase [Kitasatospora atroaurantiaca]|uniref:Glycosyltransferase involved in cell wall biosynthesis n=1 Tax=Kitasatospora atroaurantiaca TaxID=285545 RepID=A0A561F0X4_9ACTN|nr:glycosyltransferase family 4 protein [Kitasatospora atroaurantiaca]TWE21515.1 glycosyltransferase involved in cell wall biosynthesis [Kitasatospora atroaurantiaca]
MTPLRIALVHSFYASGQPSGENEAVRDQARALRESGHEVAVVAARTDELARSRLYPLRAAATVAAGRGRTPLAELREFGPDLVHVHNLFPNFARGWVHDWDGPLVATLHNYRPLCAGATLYRAGTACTSCLDGDRWAGLRHGCYRESRLATAPLAWANRKGPAGDPLLSRADRLVMLSELSLRTYLRAGIPARRTALIPNFVDDPGGPAEPTSSSGRWVFVGRLTAEKGALELLRRWPAGEPLDIVGDGELLDDARAVAPPSVRFLGRLDRAELRRRLPSWRGLVFPSRCLEGAPLVQVEALAAGLPILVFEGSSVAESVRARGTGAVVSWAEPLLPALRQAAARFPGLRSHCRRVFDEHFTEQTWARSIDRLYREVLSTI